MVDFPTPSLRARAIARDGMACRYCGAVLIGELGIRNAQRTTMDHRVPRGAGGTNRLDNVVISCMACNSLKGGNLHVARTWVPLPARYFDDAVERVLRARAALYAWSELRLDKSMLIVSGIRLLNEENIDELKSHARADRSEWVTPGHGFKPPEGTPMYEPERIVRLTGPPVSASQQRGREGDTREHIAAVVSQVLDGEQARAARERAVRLTRLVAEAAPAAETWADEVARARGRGGTHDG